MKIVKYIPVSWGSAVTVRPAGSAAVCEAALREQRSLLASLDTNFCIPRLLLIFQGLGFFSGFEAQCHVKMRNILSLKGHKSKQCLSYNINPWDRKDHLPKTLTIHPFQHNESCLYVALAVVAVLWRAECPERGLRHHSSLLNLEYFLGLAKEQLKSLMGKYFEKYKTSSAFVRLQNSSVVLTRPHERNRSRGIHKEQIGTAHSTSKKHFCGYRLTNLHFSTWFMHFEVRQSATFWFWVIIVTRIPHVSGDPNK